uniref:uncharacterized protein LOC122593613 n=1 Tax=Erigeron canadensis TaxID=72917 RepID=UPI001CB8F956|nr:uncharacterized protein LOC122593613 [Erigeron canadensis]
MLHKSFKPAKCKTSLKLATSRIKLMKNKKGVQINQIKKDLAHLLETAQDRTARIRVEHVIREEKMVAAYDLIEIYCELIVARLPIIESQKTCPIDLKEAVTSVIFAAPRCSDISELADIKKQFAAKYGKEFVTAALELRPDCGVSRMLVEKLSAVAPNLETKIKVLSAVAKEHNIEWDATSFEEKEAKPSNDLLDGPPKFENAHMEYTDPPKVQPSNNNAMHSHGEKPIAPADFSEQNRRYTLGNQNLTSTDNSGEASSSATHADMKSSGTSSERIETRQPVHRGDDDYLSGRQNWNMEFKDATAAAHAAAESAERAAMAARAAAQFSSREKMAYHHPTVSHLSNNRDQIRHVSDSPGSIGQSPLDDRKPKVPNRHIDRSEPDTSQDVTGKFDSGSIRSSEPTFSKSNNEPGMDDKVVNNLNMADGYFEESWHDNEGPTSPEMTTHEEFRESETESGNFEYESINFFAEETTKQQPSVRSSHSRSSTASGEHDVAGHQKDSKRSVVGNPFAAVDQGSPFRESTKMSSNLDDEAISDNEGGPTFDSGFEYDDIEGIHSLENAHIWSPRRSNSNKVDQQSQSHLFSESHFSRDHSFKKSVEPSETDDYVPASFDHSDGPDSESESDLPVDPKPSFVEPSEKFNSRKSRIELNDLVEEESSLYNSDDEKKRPESQHELKKRTLDQNIYDTLEGNDSLNQTDDLNSSKELNFEALTGGLRHKGGLRYPPLVKSVTTEESYMSKKSLDGSSITGGQTSLQSSLDSKANIVEDEKPGISISSSDSDSERSSKQANTKPRFSPAPFFDDDGTDTEEEVTKQVPIRVRFGAGLSRRTRGSAPAPYSKTHVELKPEPNTVIPTQYSYSEEIPAEPQPYARKFSEDTKHTPESRQHIRPSRKTVETGQIKSTTSDPRVNEYSLIKTTKSEPQVDQYSRIKPTTSEARVNQYSRIKPNTSEARVNLSVNTKQGPVETRPESKIPTREPSPIRTYVESDNSKKTKTPNLGAERSSGENLAKKPSHVHPKLPDYESLAARLQSMRTDHQ